jgi:serine/threonine protein kinase
MLAPGTVLQGRYRIERLLGQGGMSTVYLAQHLRLHRKVAVKALQPIGANAREQRGYAEQLEVEARIMASLSHPNLALVLDFFDEHGTPYLVMEFIEGRNLEEITELAPKPLTQRRVLEFTSQILNALQYLHERTPPVIVRDLKPSNVMLDAQRMLRLIDFGLAKVMSPAGKGTQDIVRGMGSLGYAPIEQYGGGRSTDQRSDLYALGATMLFLLTDKAPPEAAERLGAKTPLHDPRRINDTVTDEVWAVIRQMLELDMKDRPRTAAEVRVKLGLSPLESALKPPPPPPPTPKPGPAPAPSGVKHCPICRVALKHTRQQGIEIDYCSLCRGLWLDRGELEQIVELSHMTPRPAPGQRPPQPKTLWDHIVGMIVSPPGP